MIRKAELETCLRRARQIRAQSLAQVLRPCVEGENFPIDWRPPSDLGVHVGGLTADTAPGPRKGNPLTDLEILALIDSLPSDPPGLRWADTLRILAELGLRLDARAERAVPYSFRHSDSLRGHQLRIDAGSVALSMGHSFEVHCQSYPWTSYPGTSAAFARALATN